MEGLGIGLSKWIKGLPPPIFVLPNSYSIQFFCLQSFAHPIVSQPTVVRSHRCSAAEYIERKRARLPNGEALDNLVTMNLPKPLTDDELLHHRVYGTRQMRLNPVAICWT